MGQKGIIEQLGEERKKEILDFHIQGQSNSYIASQLNEATGENISTQQIQQYLLRQKRKIFQYKKTNENYQQGIAEDYFNSTMQLKSINKELWELFYNLKKDKTKSVSCPKCKTPVNVKDTSNTIKIISELLTQIKHVDHLLGKTNDAPLKFEVNMVSLSQSLSVQIPTMLQELQRKGDIKILRKGKYKLPN